MAQLVTIRHERRLTQRDVARLMNVHPSAVGHLERPGRDHSPTLDSLQRYAAAVGARITVERQDR